MVTLSISIDEQLAAKLTKLAKEASMTPDEVIEHALESYLAPHAGSDPIVGMFDLDDAQLSVNAEKVLREASDPHSGWTTKK